MDEEIRKLGNELISVIGDRDISLVMNSLVEVVRAIIIANIVDLSDPTDEIILNYDAIRIKFFDQLKTDAQIIESLKERYYEEIKNKAKKES